MIPFRRDLYQPYLLGLLGALIEGMGGSHQNLIWPFLASFVGYGFILLAMRKKSLLFGWSLFSIASLIHSSWLLSHPFSYIIGVWLSISITFAFPYALLAHQFLKSPPSLMRCVSCAAAFAVLEHLFASLPCGYSFQCAALHISAFSLPLQLASIVGGIGLSFLVYVTNLLFFYALETRCAKPFAIALIAPYLFGSVLYLHRASDLKQAPLCTAAICHLEDPAHVTGAHLPPTLLHEQAWRQIFQCLLPSIKQRVDLIVLPEIAVPYSAHSHLLRSTQLPIALQDSTPGLLSSLEIAEKISSYLKAPLLIGLEGRDSTKSYNSCFFIHEKNPPLRYDKQLLLPLGEYIPFPFLSEFLSHYGIHASFTAGDSPALFTSGPHRFSPLICYEETFSHYACKAFELRPTLIVGMSNDVWYPDVRHQHFELAKLRAAELGLPLIRACNHGISAAVDSLGRTIASADKGSCCLIASFPSSSHAAPFAYIGERLAALMLALVSALFHLKRPLLGFLGF